jgi:anti-anti-sigma regulatory factor
VLDFSKVREMDTFAVYLLLCCLEEAMKHDGDIKLAAIPLETKTLLELAGLGRFFESFETNAEAINSFRRISSGGTSYVSVSGGYTSTSNSAT